MSVLNASGLHPAKPSPTPGTGSIYRRLISSLDIDEVFANMPKLQIEHQVLSRPHGESRSGTMMLPSLALTSNLISPRTRASGGIPRGHLVLAVDIAGVPGRQFGGSPLEPDDALVGYDGAEFDYINSPGFLGVSVVVPGHEIEAALECGFGGGTLAQYRNVQTRRLENRQSPQWRLFRSIAAILQQDTHTPAPASALFARADLVDVIATIVRGRRGEESGDRQALWFHRRPVARRAEEFMRAHLGEPIALHQICAAARASERTVEYAFHDLYGIGAKKFLQLLRLNRAHALLRSPAGGSASIQDVAHACGFWHMGHFSVNYRRLFGESPTATLRREQIQRIAIGIN
jgi:AraC-like DNA-binding protein